MNSTFFTAEQFEVIVNIQNTLNEKFVPNFLNEISLEQYAIALINEVSEFLESTPRFHNHKYWKTYQQDDVQNSIVEIVDVLHFGLSCMIKLNGGVITKSQYETMNRKTRHDEDFLSCYYKMIAACSNQRNLIAFFYAFKSLMIHMCEYHKIPFDKLFDVYIQKSNLNFKRVDGGYTKGEYEKVKDGKEDNRAIVT